MTPKQNRYLDSDAMAARFRASAVDVAAKKLLITNFSGTEQEHDLTEPANCGGFGRIRHFGRRTSSGWPDNPLPIDPVSRYLGIPHSDVLCAQVFQNAICNWRCWYCFVPFNLLSANPKYSAWLSPSALVDLYLDQPSPPPMIDLTGGQPDLVPEWVPWMMTELRHRGLDRQVYLWSDDNLSTDYLWRYLSDSEIELMVSYPGYSRVCCFKGFDAESFAFNTGASPDLFERQFELMQRLLSLGLDVYGYVTLTGASSIGVHDSVRSFMDRLQAVDENLPLRTVPLEIGIFTPVAPRMTEERTASLDVQRLAVEVWQQEIAQRYPAHLRSVSISEVPLKR